MRKNCPTGLSRAKQIYIVLSLMYHIDRCWTNSDVTVVELGTVHIELRLQAKVSWWCPIGYRCLQRPRTMRVPRTEACGAYGDDAPPRTMLPHKPIVTALRFHPQRTMPQPYPPQKSAPLRFPPPQQSASVPTPSWCHCTLCCGTPAFPSLHVLCNSHEISFAAHRESS